MALETGSATASSFSGLGLDPTLLWTQRGQNAIARMDSANHKHLRVPSAFVDDLEVIRGAYFSRRGLFGFYNTFGRLALPSEIRTVGLDGASARAGLRDVGSARVGAEIWTILNEGAIVVARRHITLDALLLCGAELSLRAADNGDDEQFLSNIGILLGRQNAELILRRTRFLLTAGRRGTTEILVADRGGASYY